MMAMWLVQKLKVLFHCGYGYKSSSRLLLKRWALRNLAVQNGLHSLNTQKHLVSFHSLSLSQNLLLVHYDVIMM